MSTLRILIHKIIAKTAILLGNIPLAVMEKKYKYEIFNLYFLEVDQIEIENLRHKIECIQKILEIEGMVYYKTLVVDNINSVGFINRRKIPCAIGIYDKSIFLHPRWASNQNILLIYLLCASYYIMRINKKMLDGIPYDSKYLWHDISELIIKSSESMRCFCNEETHDLLVSKLDVEAIINDLYHIFNGESGPMGVRPHSDEGGLQFPGVCPHSGEGDEAGKAEKDGGDDP